MSITATLIIQIIVFAILAWFSMRFIWPPLAKALDERAKKIADGLEAADRAKAELNDANKRVEEQLTQTREEATKRIADADQRGVAIVNEARERAGQEAEKIIQQAKAEAQLQVSQARDALRDQVAVLAVKGAEQILEREVDANAHAELLERLKAQL